MAMQSFFSSWALFSLLSVSSLSIPRPFPPPKPTLTPTPSAAVAARFGIGKDFWLNLLLTICGYIPGVYLAS